MKDIMLIVHFIGIIMTVGTGFAFLFLGKASGKLPENEREKFMLGALPVTMMANIGLVLLILSGGYLMTPYWSILFQEHILMTKLTLVLVLIGLNGMMSINGKKARENGGGVHLQKVASQGRILSILGVVIIILAVLHFH